MRLATGKLHLRALAGSKAAVDDVPRWTGTEWKPGAAATGPVLYVSIAADGPPTDGSVFWYVTDESC